MIFLIAMGAEYLFYMKSIETYARAFLALIILPIGTVYRVVGRFENPGTHSNLESKICKTLHIAKQQCRHLNGAFFYLTRFFMAKEKKKYFLTSQPLFWGFSTKFPPITLAECLT